MATVKDGENKEEPKAPAATPRVGGYGFACGGGPCKTFRVFENEPTLPKLPAPSKPKS
jgi:hypothetical protein